MKRVHLLLLLALAGCGAGASAAADKPTGSSVAGYHRVAAAIQESYPCPPVCREGLTLSMPYIHYDASHAQHLVQMITAAGPGAILVDFDSAKSDGAMHHWHAVYAPDSAQ